MQYRLPRLWSHSCVILTPVEHSIFEGLVALDSPEVMHLSIVSTLNGLYINENDFMFDEHISRSSGRWKHNTIPTQQIYGECFEEADQHSRRIDYGEFEAITSDVLCCNVMRCGVVCVKHIITRPSGVK